MNPSLTSTLRRGLFAALFAAGASAQATILLSDQFTDGEHETQSLTSSANWTLQTTAQFGATDTSGLNWTPTASSRTWAYFTAAGSPVSLGVGDAITFSFTVTYSTATSSVNNLRFGLFNSGDSTQQVTDGTSAFNHANLKGYTAQVNPATTSGTLSLYSEDNQGVATNSFTATGGGTYTQLGSNFTTAAAIGTTTRTVTMSVTRNASDVTLSVNLGVGGSAASVSESTLNLNSFDSIGFFHGNNTSGGLRLDAIQVETISAIPEPSTYALVGGAAVLLLAGIRRRRHGRRG